MAAHVLRLRVALLVGGLRGDSGHVTRTAVGLLLLIGAVAAACWALLTLADAAAEVALTVTVLGGAAVTLGFALAPLIAGASDPLDPRRFALLGLPRGRLATVLAVAGLISIPILTTAALAVCTAMVWTEQGAPWIAAALGMLLGIATCVLLARVCMALTSLFLRERRSRELSGLFVIVVLVVVVPIGVFLSSLEWRGTVPSQLLEAVSTLGVTPLGAAWAYPGRVALGDGNAGRSLLVAVATVIGLALIWAWLVRRLLTTTERPSSGRERGGLGWFGTASRWPG